MNHTLSIAFGGLVLLTLATSCENTIVSEYDTVKTKKLILVDEAGKEHEVTVDKKGQLVVK